MHRQSEHRPQMGPQGASRGLSFATTPSLPSLPGSSICARASVVTRLIPLTGKDGELIQSVGHPAMSRPTKRRSLRLGRQAPSLASAMRIWPARSRPWAKLTARMHLHSRQWRRPECFERLTWDFETSIGNTPHWGRWQDGMGFDAGKARAVRQDRRSHRQPTELYGKGQERFGLIHCDLRLANLLVDGKTVKVIDFDDSGFGWFMYDAATPVSFYEHDPKVPDLIAAWLKGYKSVSDIAREDEEEIPTFVMLAASPRCLDRLASRDRAGEVDGHSLHAGNGRTLRGVSAEVRIT